MSCMMLLLSSEPHWSRGSTLLVPYKVPLYFSLLSKLSLKQQREMTTPKAPLSTAGAMFELSGWRMRSPRGGAQSSRGVLLPSCPPAVPWWPLPSPLLEGASVAAGLKGPCRLLPCVLSGPWCEEELGGGMFAHLCAYVGIPLGSRGGSEAGCGRLLCNSKQDWLSHIGACSHHHNVNRNEFGAALRLCSSVC